MSDIKITISSLEEPVEGSKFKRLSHKTIRVKGSRHTVDENTETGSTDRAAQAAAVGEKRPVETTDSSSVAVNRPRRQVKPVVRYEPTEVCTDDFGESDYDTDDSDGAES